MALKKFGRGPEGGGDRNAITLIFRGKHVRNRYLTEFAHTGSTTKIADSVTCILTLIRASFNMNVNKQIICARLLLLFYWLTILREISFFIMNIMETNKF